MNAKLDADEENEISTGKNIPHPTSGDVIIDAILSTNNLIE